MIPAASPVPAPPAGVFYVATEQPRFVAEACASAASLRRCLPGVHVTLFTDQQPDGLVDLFDRVEPLPLAEGVGTSWGAGLLGKVRAFARSPYEKSLYLDTDTRVLTGQIGAVFAWLEGYEFAIAECEAGESRNQQQSGERMFNSGVVAFRRTARVRQLLVAWLELQEAHARAIRERTTQQFEYVRHLRGVERLYQLVADQTALARYLSPEVNAFGINCLTLPRTWNWRNDDLDAASGSEVVVHHASKYKVDPL